MDRKWVQEHYRLGPDKDNGSAPDMLCNRCNQPVQWLTKHAVQRHGDPITVVQPERPEPPGGWLW